MVNREEPNSENISSMNAGELREAISDKDLRLSSAAVASLCASLGAALLSRASSGMTLEEISNKALSLSVELEAMASRLDMADEFYRLTDEPSQAALSAGAEASVALLEACYFGQSLAKSASVSATREASLDLSTAAMLIDAAAGSALMSATRCLVDMKDTAEVEKLHELIWAITHDRIGAKKEVIDTADALLRRSR